MAGKNINSFWNRNLVAIVMIPTIVGIHFGWMALQKNDTLVREDERIELPIVTSAKYLLDKMTGKNEPKNES